MDLVTAIDPGDGPISVVGAGGKTTTMYALASRLPESVVTATVRIPIFDREVSNVVVTPDPVAALEDATADTFPLGLVPERERSDRYLGYEPDVVSDLAAAHDGPTIVKADGARMREFKAPGGHEPRIPSSTSVVVAVVSAHVVGKPLTGHWVHRPERVSELTDTDVGDEITADTVAAVLAHEEGGLEGVPDGARLVPLVTKVDSSEHEQAARDIAAGVHERATSQNIDVPRVALARFDAFEAM